MIEIVSFKRKNKQVEIGYRKGNAVVYAAISGVLSDAEAKQKGYEQIWRALEYEQTLDKPSFTVGDNVDDDGNVIEYEKFTPEDSKVVKISIDGPSSVYFGDESEDKIVDYEATAYDQYGEKVETKSIEQTFNNKDYTQDIKFRIGEVEEVLSVSVFAYRKPEPSEVELMSEYVMDVDFRVALLELGFKE